MHSPTTSLHHAAGAVVSDQPIDRITFDSLTERQRAQLRGAIIFDRLIAHGLSDKLAQLKRQREIERGRNDGSKRERFGGQAVAVLALLALRFGELVPDVDGLMIFKSREEIARAITGSWKSTYPLIQQLEDVGVVKPVRRWGPYKDVFYLPEPPPTPEELHQSGEKNAMRAEMLAAQEARATQEKSCLTEKPGERKPLLAAQKARAGQEKSCLTENGAVQSGHFEAESGSARRAGFSGPSDDDDDSKKELLSSSPQAEGPDAEEVFQILCGTGMFQNRARKFSRTLSLVDALTVQDMVSEAKPANPGAWAAEVIENGVPAEARNAVRRKLHIGPSRQAQTIPATKGGCDDDDYRIG